MGPENDHSKKPGTHINKLSHLLDEEDWSHLDGSQKEDIYDLVLNHAQLFIVDKKELGLINRNPVHIQVKDPFPCRSPIYRYPEKARGHKANPP